jgi:hypothetical protein
MASTLKDLYKILSERRDQERSFKRALAKETLMDFNRRDSIAKKNLLKFIEKGAQAAGVDFQKIQSMHLKEFGALKDKQAVRLQKIRTYVKEAAQRRQAHVKQLAQMKDFFTGAKGNPTSLICLWTADKIDVKGVVVGNTNTSPVTTQKAFGHNIFQGTISAGESYGSNFMFIDFDFVAPNPPQGLLTATGAYNVNGIYDLTASGACIGTNSASAQLSCNLRVSQMNSAGAYIDVMSPIAPNVDESVESGCSASSDSGPLCDRDEQSVSNLTPYPVVAGYPIIASLEFTLHAYTSGDASSAIDLLSDPEFDINAISIWLVIDVY